MMMVHVRGPVNTRGRRDIAGSRGREGCHATHHGWYSQVWGGIFLSQMYHYRCVLHNNNNDFLLCFNMLWHCPQQIQVYSPSRSISLWVCGFTNKGWSGQRYNKIRENFAFHFNLYCAVFKFLGSTHMYGFNWDLNPLKVLYVTKYSVFIAFFKLKTQNKNSITENELIYLHTMFHNNQSLIHIYFSFIFSYFDFFMFWSIILWNLTPYCIFMVAECLGVDCTWLELLSLFGQLSCPSFRAKWIQSLSQRSYRLQKSEK
jgi:hypothetical protein